MPDQGAAFAIAEPPTVLTNRPGPALDTDAGGRVIPLDTRRRRPSAAAVAASRACHPSQMWADGRLRPQPAAAVAIPS